MIWEWGPVEWAVPPAGFSGMDEESALVILRHMAQEFVSLVERERVVYLAGQGEEKGSPTPLDDCVH